MTSNFDPIPAEVRAYRDAQECGFVEAKRELRRRRLLAEVRSIAFGVEDLPERFERLLTLVEAMIEDGHR